MKLLIFLVIVASIAPKRTFRRGHSGFSLSLSFASSLQQDIFAQLNEGAEGTQRAKGYLTVRFF